MRISYLFCLKYLSSGQTAFPSGKTPMYIVDFPLRPAELDKACSLGNLCVLICPFRTQIPRNFRCFNVFPLSENRLFYEQPPRLQPS